MPTALELGPKNWKSYLKGSKHHHCQAQQIDAQEYSVLIKQIRNASKRIKSELGAKRVRLIGSLIHGAWWHEGSDIDLVVEGVTAANYWKAWGIAEETIAKHRVEVIDLDTATPRLRKKIENEGMDV